MKKKFYIKAALGLFMSMALFSSCLKDTVRQPDFTGDGPVVDFAVVPFGNNTPTATLLAANTTNSLNALISLSGQHDYTTPTSVTIAVLDQTAVSAVNAAYVLLPASTYTVGSLTTSGNPGIQQRIENQQPIVGTPLPLPSASEAMISFTVNTAAYQALDQTKTYILPLRITSVSGNGAVIDQYNTVYFKLAIK